MNGPIEPGMHLYADLAFDSLDFASLIVAIEEEFFIEFALGEMEPCLVVGRLLMSVKEKAQMWA
jgi:acyl carrier protein